MLLRPLPYADPDRLYVVTEAQPDMKGLPVSYLNWRDYLDGTSAFTGLAAVGRMNVNLTGDGPPERLIADLYSHETLTVLGVEPALGRNFLPEEDRANGPRAVILSHDVWARRFAEDPAILGRAIVLDREPWTVVGVMREGYEFAFEGTDIIQPLGNRADTPIFRDRNTRTSIFLVGRLEPGVTPSRSTPTSRPSAPRSPRAFRTASRQVAPSSSRCARASSSCTAPACCC